MYFAEGSLIQKKTFRKQILIIGTRMENQISNIDLFIRSNILEKIMTINLHFRCTIETSLKAMI